MYTVSGPASTIEKAIQMTHDACIATEKHKLDEAMIADTPGSESDYAKGIAEYQGPSSGSSKKARKEKAVALRLPQPPQPPQVFPPQPPQVFTPPSFSSVSGASSQMMWNEQQVHQQAQQIAMVAHSAAMQAFSMIPTLLHRHDSMVMQPQQPQQSPQPQLIKQLLRTEAEEVIVSEEEEEEEAEAAEMPTNGGPTKASKGDGAAGRPTKASSVGDESTQLQEFFDEAVAGVAGESSQVTPPRRIPTQIPVAPRRMPRQIPRSPTGPPPSNNIKTPPWAIDRLPPVMPPAGPTEYDGIKSVEIFSFGLNDLNIDCRMDYKHIIPLLEEKFQRQFGQQSKTTKPVIWIDARQFHWPRCPKGHSGEHTNAIKHVVNNKGFPQWLSLVKDEFMFVNNMHRDSNAVLAVYCKAGCNRSVSCARILREVLLGCGYIMKDLVHLSGQAWTDRNLCTGFCHKCIGGDGMSFEKYSYFEHAFNTWISI